MKRRGIFSILVALVLVSILVTFLITLKVRINERALVFTFGKVARPITEPGLYLKLPYPIQTVQRYDTRVNVFEGKFQEVYTEDGKNLVVTVAVGWSVQDPQRFYESLRTSDEARKQLEGLVGSETNSVMGRHKFSQLVSTVADQLRFDDIEREIAGNAEQGTGVAYTAHQRYGIHLDFVRITQLGLPEKVTERVFDRMKAERERIAKKFRAEGRGKAEELRAKADYEKAVLLDTAEAEAKRLRGEGDAAADKAYETFRQNEELAIFLLKLDAIRQLKDVLTVVIDTRTPPWDIVREEVESILAKRTAPRTPSAPARGGE